MSDPTALVSSALKRHPLCRGMSVRERDALLLLGEIRRCAAGETMLREGDAPDFFWLLCRGSARIFYRSSEGFEVTVKIFRAPAGFAELEVLTGQPHVENVAAVDRCTVLCLPREAFLRLLDDSPAFTKNLLHDTAARFLIAAQNERALAFLSAPQRLAHLLLAYVRVYGVPVEGGIGLRIKLTQDELANGLGATRRTIARTLADWQKQGLLSRRSPSYVIHHPERLLALASDELIGVDWVSGSGVQEGRGAAPRPHNWDDFTPVQTKARLAKQKPKRRA